MSKQISADDVHAALGRVDVVFIDVRTPGEYAKGYIQGSINIPVDSIRETIGQYVADKNTIVYMYCLSGSRSDMAAEILNSLGYSNAYSMTSGLLMWRSKKFEIISS